MRKLPPDGDLGSVTQVRFVRTSSRGIANDMAG